MVMQTIPEDLRQSIAQHQLAINGFINGNPGLLKSLCSRRDDIAVIGAWGAYDRGWAQVERRLDWACRRFQGGNNRCEFENVTLVAGDDLAFSVDLERNQVTLKGDDRVVAMTLRVTTAFRKEDGAWRLVLRHGDPLVAEQAIDSVAPPRG
jgi:ketosteroid isomerase-like protein